MLIGLNERLERVLRDYCGEESETDPSDVLTALAESAAAGDDWQVPVEPMPEGMNETDFAEGSVPEQFPFFVRKTLRRGGETMFCAFTSTEKVSAGDMDGPLITVKMPARQILEEIAAGEEGMGLVLNPFSDSVPLTREEAGAILREAECVSEDRIRSLQCIRIEPRAVIDTGRILDEWSGEWDEGDGNEENWELRAYPIMPDGRILLLFEMKDELCEADRGSVQSAHSVSRYRVLEYVLDGRGLRLVGRYRFRGRDMHVATVMVRNGKLKGAVSFGDDREYSVLQLVPPDDGRQFGIFANVRELIIDSRENVIVAYEKNLHDPARVPLMIYDRDGETAATLRDAYALACRTLNLDREENIWYHIHPSDSVDMYDPVRHRRECYPVQLQGFDAMAMSDDGTRLFLEFDAGRTGSAFYVLTRNEHGAYVDPIRFEFRPETEDGEEKDIGAYTVFGCGSTMKSRVLLNADGKLYLYDVNDC